MFPDNVNMNTLTDKIMSVAVKVVHIAFKCGCVHSYTADKAFRVDRCPEHGDAVHSSTTEYQDRSAAA